jgi:hypothetical protein
MCDKSPVVMAHLERTACGPHHEALEQCLKDHDRDWRKCQAQLKSFGECFNKTAETGTPLTFGIPKEQRSCPVDAPPPTKS